MVPSLPPILHRRAQRPTPGCSKAPRGLFVLPRVGRIFTASSISPGPSPRQRPSRYAFRAGRNLPDKEFRYLRTVIVTAAVHRGFGSELAPLPLTFRHRASVAPYTSSYEFAESCVFGKQSPGPVHCGSPELITPESTPSPEVTGLTCRVPWRGFARAPWCSYTRPPVSVSGTGTPPSSLRGFSRPPGFGGLSPQTGLPDPRRASAGRICLPCAPQRANGLSHSSAPPSLGRPPFAPGEWGRNINRLSFGFPSRLRLRPRLTLRRRTLRRNPWAFGGGDSHPTYRYSCRHSHFPYLQRPSRSAFPGLGNAPLPPRLTPRSVASALGLSPVHFRRGVTRPVSYYALFK